MKKLSLLVFVAIMLLLAGIIACTSSNNINDDDSISGNIVDTKDDGIISGTIIGKCAEWETVSACYGGGTDYMAIVPIIDGKFNLSLPKHGVEKYLLDLDKYLEEGFKISVPQVKFTYMEFFVCKDSERTHLFAKGNSDGSEFTVNRYFYVDRDVNVSGLKTGEYFTEKWDLNLKNGWNAFVSYEKGAVEEYNVIYISDTFMDKVVWSGE